MTNKQTLVASYGLVGNRENSVLDQKSLVANPKKKKPSWMHTIMWMLSMALLANVTIALLFYTLYHYKIIQ